MTVLSLLTTIPENVVDSKLSLTLVNLRVYFYSVARCCFKKR